MKIKKNLIFNSTKISEINSYYKKYGYVVIESLFTNKELFRIEQLIDKVMINKTIGNTSSFETNDLIFKVPKITPLIFKKKYLNVLKKILGCKFLDLQHSKYNAKNPKGNSKILPHQDFVYFPHTDNRLLAFTFHLDGSSKENGGMFFYANKWNKPINHRNLRINQRSKILKNLPIHHLVCPPGSVSIHSSLVLHGSNNSSGKNRRMCVYQLRHPENKQIGGALWRCSNINPETMNYNEYRYRYMNKTYKGRPIWEPKEYFRIKN